MTNEELLQRFINKLEHGREALEMAVSNIENKDWYTPAVQMAIMRHAEKRKV